MTRDSRPVTRDFGEGIIEMSLTHELDDLRTQMRDETPPEALSTIDRATEDLSRSGILGRSLRVGDSAPDFALPNANGRTIRLGDLLARGPVVVSFYRGTWCPFCNLEMQALQRTLPAIASLGATLAAISPQTPDNSMSAAEKNCLTYEVLSDLGNTVARKFGIVFHLQDELRAIYDEFGLDLSEYNGDETFDLPVPATYVIDPTGTIRLAFVDPDYTRRLDPTEILATLRALKAAA